MPDHELVALQRWFHAAVTHADGVEAGARAAPGASRIDDVIAPSRALSAEARLTIYADAYVLRLLEVLEQDFPALAAWLGREPARALFRAYVAAHPPDHPNLNRLGRRLPAFLEAGGGEIERRAFALDLARLERAVQEIFDAPRADALGREDLEGLAPDAFGALRLPLAPHARLLALAHPVNAWYQAFREGADRAAPPAPPASPSWLVVHRRDLRVWRLALTLEQHRLLALLDAGLPLGPALERLSEEHDPARFAGELAGWFADWAGLGLFART